MKRRKPLQWERQRTTIAPGHPLRGILLEVPMFEATREVAFTAAPPIIPVSEEADIDWPIFTDLPTPVDRVEWLLQTAAEIEHALLVQYLYAGYSLTNTEHQRRLLGIAIEEMSHLMTVQNLLFGIGSEPYLARQDFGPPSDDDYRVFPFDLMLEPLSKKSLAKYILAESPRPPWPLVDLQLARLIVEEATTPATRGRVNRVGVLYTLLGVFFGTEELLGEKAAAGDSWYVAVNELAKQADNHYGGRDQVHLPEDFQFVDSLQQGTDAVWDRSVNIRSGEFRVHAIKDRATALEALRDISLQGEGLSVTEMEESHFIRFVGLFKRLFQSDGSGTGPVPVFAVPSAARIPVDPQSSDPNAITHPETVLWTRLADLRYWLLLGFLEQYLLSNPDDRQFLAAWCFTEMFHLKKLGQFLPKQQRSAADPDALAVLPFNMPEQFPSDEKLPQDDSNAADRTAGQVQCWPSLHRERLQSTIGIVEQILDANRAPAPPDEAEKKQFLEYMLEGDRRKRAEADARHAGHTVRIQFDQVRETLEWASGTADPGGLAFGHNGSSPRQPSGNQGRFWNLPLPQFKETIILGRNILAPYDTQPGSDPWIVNVLKTGFMPKDRPPLKPDGESMRYLERWIDNSCPDDPLPSEPTGSGSHD